MRKLTIILVLFTIAFSVNAQNFLNIGDQWILEHKKFVGPNAVYYQKIDSITITKDTLINAINYLKIESTLSHLCGVYEETEFVREENGKIYRLFKDLESEYLMIDFDEQFAYSIGAEIGPQYLIGDAQIDSFGIYEFPSGQKIETQFLKIINNQSYGDDYQYKVHKGIGFLNPGILFPNMGTGLCDNFWETVINKCHISNGDTIRFSDIDCFEFDILDSTDQINSSRINIFPNPTNGLINLPQGFELFKITSMSGKTKPFSKDGEFINIDNLENGIYVMYFIDKSTEKITISKIVKI